MTSLQLRFEEINGKMLTRIDNFAREDSTSAEIQIANDFENYVKILLRQEWNGIDIDDIPQRKPI